MAPTPTEPALAEEDVPIRYIERTRAYYAALGYAEPYRWAHYADVPFRPLTKPLPECRVALVTTAAPYRPELGDQSARADNPAAKFFAVYSGDAALDHDLRIAHVAVDRRHTSGDDPGSYFPLPALRRAAASGRIGGVAPRFHGLPTNRSVRHTLAVDAPELVARCREDGADVAVLVPNCPVCHQSTALAARALEAAGIATVVMGCAKDIVEHVGVPRFVFSDFPLGNAAGRPHDLPSQDATLDLALALIAGAPAARTTVQSPQAWSADPGWKRDYADVARLSPEAIARERAAFAAREAVARRLRETQTNSVASDRRAGG